MSFLAFLLLTAADPAAAAAVKPPAKTGCARPAVPAGGDAKTAAAAPGGWDDDCDGMAIDELGMPVDKKDKKGKSALTDAGAGSPAGMAISEQGIAVEKKDKKKGVAASGAGDCDDADAACRPGDATPIVRGTALGLREAGSVPGDCDAAAACSAAADAAARMAINEKGVPKKRPKKTSETK